jgi:hypothetical protein
METWEVLEKALALIEDEENWCQGHLYIGNRCCARGALMASRPLKKEVDQAGAAIRALLPGPHTIMTFNDTHSHAEVVDLFQTAIRNEKQKARVLVEIPREVAPLEARKIVRVR